MKKYFVFLVSVVFLIGCSDRILFSHIKGTYSYINDCSSNVKLLGGSGLKISDSSISFYLGDKTVLYSSIEDIETVFSYELESEFKNIDDKILRNQGDRYYFKTLTTTIGGILKISIKNKHGLSTMYINPHEGKKLPVYIVGDMETSYTTFIKCSKRY